MASLTQKQEEGRKEGAHNVGHELVSRKGAEGYDIIWRSLG